jgi:two-component system sensor histidine kinase KdpD
MGAATALDSLETSENPVLVREFANQLVDASDRLNRVIENLLDMSRLNAGAMTLKLEWQDVADLVHVTVTRLTKSLPKSQRDRQFSIHLPEGLPLIQVDFRLFEHALSNLLLNAALYTPKEKAVEVRAWARANVLYLTVADEGPGIPEELREKIFEKFYRVPGTPAGGTGLGLSIAKSITELHGGKLSVKNRASGGAQFTFEFPLRPQPTLPSQGEIT